MKKLVLYGDGFLCPASGYGESLIDLLVMRRPEADFVASLPGEEQLTAEAAPRDLPLLIGKAPDFVFLSLGSADMLRGTDPAAAFAALESLVQTLLQKTRARVAAATVCAGLLPPDARPAATAFNALLTGLPESGGDRVRVIDLHTPVEAFFERHRRSRGEKRSLVEGAPTRLTSMGRVFLSHAAWGQLGLEEWFPE